MYFYGYRQHQPHAFVNKLNYHFANNQYSPQTFTYLQWNLPPKNAGLTCVAFTTTAVEYMNE